LGNIIVLRSSLVSLPGTPYGKYILIFLLTDGIIRSSSHEGLFSGLAFNSDLTKLDSSNEYFLGMG